MRLLVPSDQYSPVIHASHGQQVPSSDAQLGVHRSAVLVRGGAHRMHGGEHGVLVDASISGEEEKAPLVVGLGGDRQHVALRDAEFAAAGLPEAALEVALVSAVDLAAVDGRGVDLPRRRAALLNRRHQPVKLHAARPRAVGDLDGIGGAVEVVNCGYRCNAVTWRRAVLSGVYGVRCVSSASVRGLAGNRGSGCRGCMTGPRASGLCGAVRRTEGRMVVLSDAGLRVEAR